MFLQNLIEPELELTLRHLHPQKLGRCVPVVARFFLYRLESKNIFLSKSLVHKRERDVADVL